MCCIKVDAIANKATQACVPSTDCGGFGLIWQICHSSLDRNGGKDCSADTTFTWWGFCQ